MAATGWWNAKRERAATLIAMAEIPREQIADELGIGRRTLYDWLAKEEFKARVEEIQSEIREEIRTKILTTGIADKAERVKAGSERHTLMQSIVMRQLENYAAATLKIDPEVPECMAELASDTDEDDDDDGAGVDHSLLKELRQIEKQIAIEVGDWQEAVGDNTVKAYINLDIDRV